MSTSPVLRCALSLSVLVPLLVACSEGAPEPTTGTEPSANASTDTPAPSASGATLIVEGIELSLPEGWQQQAPANPMRAAEATIPGDGGEGLLTVFFFGAGGGGTAQMNIDRWIGQMEAEPGTEPMLSSAAVGDYQISYVEHDGTLKASRMGTFPSTDQPDYRLLGAVIEGPGGPWFLKAVGPYSTLEAQGDAFRAMVESVRPSSS